MKYIFFILMFLTKSAYGQTVYAYFKEDSLLIGNKISLVLKCQHDNSKELVFPNSTARFDPFILKNIEYFASSVQNGLVTDSVIYDLITYNVDSIVSIKLAVRDFKSKEKYESNLARIKIKNLVSNSQKSELKSSLLYYDIPVDINFPKIFYYSVILIFISYLVYFFIGDIIRRYVKVLIYKKQHRDFTNKFKNFSSTKTGVETHKSALIAWKIHAQWLLGVPITTMTSKEIKTKLKNERLGDALNTFDSIIFGGLKDGNINFAYDRLLETSNKIYQGKLKEYKSKLKNQ